ncbi:MAG: folylpolyglutamate synthase/dihydrofolate synthase family protein [Bacteroidota bacterium]|nr:folylpolyglutamate synthase/dihydrofolate synthase family protein [Bacteroidota bacterium]
MTYQETLDYLYSQLPMYQRVGKAAFKKDLTNIKKLCELAGHPEKKFESIHIAGTNGKGSVSHMLASVFQEAGYKVGLYTSPHLKSYRERIRINGQMIPKDRVTAFVDKRKGAFDEIKPSYFEMTVAMAFEYFAEEKVDIAVIETGLGGRLDSTNIIKPLLSVITNIGYDHTQFLGNSLREIAYEKAGIIKRNTPVIIGEVQSATKNVFMDKADMMNAQIYFADYLFSIDYTFLSTDYKQILNIYKSGTLFFENLHCDLAGSYQKKNVITAVQVFEVLCGAFSISKQQLYAGLANVVKNTGLTGRWQVLGFNPLTVADTAHNVEGLKLVLQQIAYTAYKNLHIVLGVVDDKVLDKILPIFPQEASYYFTQSKVPRALPAEQLKPAAAQFGLQGVVIPDVKSALEEAKKNAVFEDFIFVGGSTFVVAEVI